MCQLACRSWIEGCRYVASLEMPARFGLGTSGEVVRPYLFNCHRRIMLLGKWRGWLHLGATHVCLG